MWYVYILRSEKNGRIYTGYTEDLKRRVQEHSIGKVLSTKGLRPLKLVYYEAFLSKEDASVEERFLKTGIGREVIRKKIQGSLSI